MVLENQKTACTTKLTAAQASLDQLNSLSTSGADGAETINDSCASSAALTQSSYTTLSDTICCPSLTEGPLAQLGNASGCAAYVESMSNVCDVITACVDTQLSGRRKLASQQRQLLDRSLSNIGAVVTLTVLTQGMRDADVVALTLDLEALLSDYEAFEALFGVELYWVDEFANAQTVNALPLDEDVLDATSINGGGGGREAAVFASFGFLIVLCFVWVYFRDHANRSKHIATMRLMDIAQGETISEGTGGGGMSLAGRSVKARSVKHPGNAPGSELATLEGGGANITTAI